MELNPSDIEFLLKHKPALAREYLRRLQAELAEEPQYLIDLHPKQRAFVEDPARRKAAVCGRRAGKSHGVGVWLLEGARAAPHQMSLYIALSRNNARGIMERALRDLERNYKIGLRFFERDNQLMIGCPNGHEIWLAGCKDSFEIEKFRGYKFKRVAIDEAASFGPYLRSLIQDVLTPTLLDLKGDLALIGSPGVIPAGPFYEITEGDPGNPDGFRKWPTFHWNVFDNPYIPHAAEEAREERERRHWDETHPTYVREWLGHWVRDDGALVYPYDNRNIFGTLPSDRKWRYSIGLDVGFKDSSAFSVAAWSIGFPEVFIVEAFKEEKLIPSKFAARVEYLMKKYDTRDAVIDSGGIGKGYQEEMFERWGIYTEKAMKNKKRAFIEVLRGELLSANLKVQPDKASPLLDEWARLVWNEDRTEPDNRFEDHVADATLYVVRHIHAGNKPQYETRPLTHEERMARVVTSDEESRYRRALKGKREDSLGRAVKEILARQH